MVAIEHRQKPTASESTATTTTTMSSNNNEQQDDQQHDLDEVIEMTQQQSEQQQLTTTNSVRVFHSEKMSKNDLESAALVKKLEESAAAAITKSAVSQRSVEIKLGNDSHTDEASKDLTKKVLKLDLSAKDLDEFSLKSPKSPITARLPHQTSLTSSVDVEDRKTLREALYQGIFHRHRRTIFAVGSFLRMLRSRTTNSQYNTIRSTSEGEDTEEVR